MTLRRFFPTAFVPAAILVILAVVNPLALQAQPGQKAPQPVPTSDLSYKYEVKRAINRGLEWLEANQNPEGWWSTRDHPAVTALALLSFKGHPDGKYRKQQPAWMNKAYDYLTASAREDGSIQRAGLATYNTSLGLLALVAADRPDYNPIMRKARRYLVGFQADFDEKGELDSPYDGGIGYGSKYDHSDMGNTLQALEALYYSRHLVEDQPGTPDKDLDWKAAINFLQNCQNLTSHNKLKWASDDPRNKGGFVYYPGLSKAGTETNKTTGRVALRSYGSISYAGLLSYIYAQLKKDDPRIQAVLDWLSGNYTLKENPGMGAQGLYYYYHTMSKALSIYGMKELRLKDGTVVDWRRELSMRLINLQKKDGSWFNDQHGRWWEKDPALVTAYAVLALERIYDSL